MDNDRMHVDADLVRRRRRGTAVRAVVALLALLVLAVAGLLAWQLTSASPARRSGEPPKTSARGGSSRSRSGPPVAKPTTASTTTTGAGPLRVVEIGDSLGVDLGDAMKSTWSSASVQLTIAALGDTGLANSGYYDWPAALAGLLATGHPQVVIVFLGANDLQSMAEGSTILYDGTPAWNTQYAARVTTIISESVRAGARLLWIGEPAMQTSFINAGMTRIDGIAERVVAHYPGEAAYLSSNSVLAPDGTFSFDVSGPTGQEVQVRTPDGVHLMPAGADLLATAVARALASAWGMQVTGH